jgi:DNA-binding SARP family transcriptional activator
MLASGGQLDAAIEHLKTSVDLQPEGKAAHYQLARAYRRRGMMGEAERETEIFQRLGEETTDDAWRGDRLEPIRREP